MPLVYKIRCHRDTACRMFALRQHRYGESWIGGANRRDVSRWFKDDEAGTWHSSTDNRRQCRHGCINSMVHYRQCLRFFNYCLADGESSLRRIQGRSIKKILDWQICDWTGEQRIYFPNPTLRISQRKISPQKHFKYKKILKHSDCALQFLKEDLYKFCRERSPFCSK